MNEHLKRKHLKKIVKGLILIVFFLVVFYISYPRVFDTLVTLLIIYIIRSIREKVLLEIEQNENVIIFKSFSIFRGNHEFILTKENFIEINYFDKLVLKYWIKSNSETLYYLINAEPWNELYEQIRKLKNVNCNF